MPGVVVSWNGQCRDHKIQEDLCVKISELGEVSHRMFKEFYGQEINIEHYDTGNIPGEILISRHLFYKRSLPSSLEQVDKGLYKTNGVSLFGISFSMFDPRRYNSLLMMAHSYDINFVFLRSPVDELDGQIVRVYKIEPDESRYSSLDGEYLLTTPELDLRYYLENWIGEFLGWVKHFYIPGLWYWAWRDYPGYDGYEQYSHHDQQARDEIFMYLRDSFVAEAESWKSSCLIDLESLKQDSSSEYWGEFDEVY